MCVCVCERERETETQRDRDRQTETETGTETETERDRERQRETETETEICRPDVKEGLDLKDDRVMITSPIDSKEASLMTSLVIVRTAHAHFPGDNQS